MPTLSDLQLWLPTLASALLLIARVLGLCATAPGWSSPGLSWPLRVVGALWMATAVWPLVGPTLIVPHGEMLGWMVLGELIAGATLGLTAGLIIAGARQAGEVVGMQTGLSPAALFDPEIGDELTPMGHLYGLIALAAFLSLDGPLALVRGLADSYQTWPPGGLGSAEAVYEAFSRVAQSLALAVRAASPAALALTLAGIAIGLLGRAAPSLPLVALSMPIRFGVGLVIILASVGTLVATLTSAWMSAGLGFVP